MSEPLTSQSTLENDRADPPPAATPPAPSLLGKVWTTLQFFIALGMTGAMLFYLLFSPPGTQDSTEGRPERPEPMVEVVGPGAVRINPKSQLFSRLQIVTLVKQKVSDPVLNATGTVAASLRPGPKKGTDYWQFNSPELLSAYTDYEKARADIAFAKTQLAAIQELAETRVQAQQKVVDRLSKLVKIGTDSQKDLDTEKANLLQFRIQGRKDVHEAETAVRVAQRSEAATARQLQQGGLEPDLLTSITSDYDLVMAEVPEAQVTRVKVGQQCKARFFGIPNQVFTGRVARLSPIVTRERRTLRVLFAVDDLKDQLRPGMFAEIGIGTDERLVLRIPADALIHIGRSDYVLVQGKGDRYRVRVVDVGEQHAEDVDVLAGLSAGEEVVGQGAILLKPYIDAALQARATNPTPTARAGQNPEARP